MQEHVSNEGEGTETSVLRNPNLHIIFCITLAAIMGVSSITPALPLIAQTFGVTLQEIALLITVFTVPGIVLTPVLGVLADLYGRKKVLVPSMFLFGLAGFACTFADTYAQLLFFRFLQGIGVAAIGALNVTMIGDLFDGNRRAKAMGYNSAVLGIGASLYPAIGGLLAAVAWYYPFYLPLLAIPVALLIQFRLKNPEPDPQSSLRTYFMKVAANLKNKNILLLFVGTTISFFLLYGPILTFLPFLIDDRFTQSSFLIGITISCLAISNGTSAFFMGRLAARFNERNLLKLSYSLYAVALLLMPLMPSLFTLALSIILFGLAQGINLPVIITMLADEARLSNRAAIMSLNGMILRIAQTIAPLCVAFLFAWAGTMMMFVICAALALVMGTVLIFYWKRMPGVELK